MRSLLKVLSKVGFAAAIADKAIEGAPDDATRQVYMDMDNAAMTALKAFPGQLSKKEIEFLHKRISEFCDRMGWDHKKRHIHSYLLFSTEQLETTRRELIDHGSDSRRVKAIEKLIQVEANIYDRYADREYPLCAMAGQRANEVWDEIWSK